MSYFTGRYELSDDYLMTGVDLTNGWYEIKTEINSETENVSSACLTSVTLRLYILL